MRHDLADVMNHYQKEPLTQALEDLSKEERIGVSQYDETGKDTEQMDHHLA